MHWGEKFKEAVFDATYKEVSRIHFDYKIFKTSILDYLLWTRVEEIEQLHVEDHTPASLYYWI